MNAPPFNANPIIPFVIGPVLTICLPVSIYAHIWRYLYLSVGVHFMSIYGDHCRYSSGSILCPCMPIYGDICLFASILCPYMEISVSVCLCPFMPVYGDLCDSASIVCPYMPYMEISVYLRPFYAHI